MTFHRLLEPREIDGRLRSVGALLLYAGPPVPYLEPLDVPEHTCWLRTLPRPALDRAA